MFSEFEYDGLINNSWSWKDNLYFFHSLDVVNELNFHNGCVNTINWDESGEYLISGSDDRHIAIARFFSEYSKGQAAYCQKLPAFSNIFTAKFLPCSGATEAVVGFKCGCLLHVLPNSNPSNVHLVFCHNFAVYDILTFPEHPNCFLSLSHDHSVCCFDTRLPTKTITAQCSRNCFSSRDTLQISSQFTEFDRLEFDFPVTAGDVHPLDGSRCIALSTADGFVRLFDLRRPLTSANCSTPNGDTAKPMPFRVARPLGLPAKVDSTQLRLDYGTGHITSVKFEPLYQNIHSFRHSRPGSLSTTCGGRRLLVSHMYAPVFLFDTNSDEVIQTIDMQRPDWLPTSESQDSTHENSNEEDEPARSFEDNLISDPNVRLTVALFRWLIRHRTQQETDADDEPQATPSDQPSSSTERDNESTCPSATRNQPQTPLDHLTDDYVDKILTSVPRCRQLLMYRGRRCCSTVIKASVFWGRDFILSGSECGHIIAWDRANAKPVNAIKADEAVVNRIAPHPCLPLLASSGIDRSIKIIEPNPSKIYWDEDDRPIDFNVVRSQHEDKTKQLCKLNETRTQETFNSGSAPFDHLTRLRTGQVARMILLRIAQSNSTNESSDVDVS